MAAVTHYFGYAAVGSIVAVHTAIIGILPLRAITRFVLALVIFSHKMSPFFTHEISCSYGTGTKLILCLPSLICKITVLFDCFTRFMAVPGAGRHSRKHSEFHYIQWLYAEGIGMSPAVPKL
jgi:hypothetical protein